MLEPDPLLKWKPTFIWLNASLTTWAWVVGFWWLSDDRLLQVVGSLIAAALMIGYLGFVAALRLAEARITAARIMVGLPTRPPESP